MSNLKIALINTPMRNKRVFQKAQPLGLGYLASFLLKNGFKDITLFDGIGKYKDIKNILEEIKKNDFNVVGFSVNQRNYNTSISLAKKIKEHNPNIIIIFGGHHPTLMFREIIQKKEVDYIILGEGELAFYKLLKCLNNKENPNSVEGIAYKQNSKVIFTPPNKNLSDLDYFPPPARHLFFDLSSYKLEDKRVGTIISSRGCPYNCSICSIRSYYKINNQNELWRRRSPKKVADEIEDLLKVWKAEEIFFVDDNFLVNQDYVKDILKETEKRNMDFKFWFLARPDDVLRNKDILPFLKKRGCIQIDLGVESGSNTQLERYGKNTTTDIIEKSLEALRKEGIKFNPYFICFDPDMTLDELKQNISFLRKIGFFNFDLVYTWLQIIPGTKYYYKLLDEKRLFGDSHLPYYHFKNPDIEKIFSLLDTFGKIHRKRIAPLLKMLKKERSRLTKKGPKYMQIIFEIEYMNLIFQKFFEKTLKEEFLENIDLSEEYETCLNGDIKFRKVKNAQFISALQNQLKKIEQEGKTRIMSLLNNSKR